MPKLGMEAIRRRQVIDAVLRILETQGWADLTILEVSKVAGISSGVVVHYFGNKRDMVVDAIADAGNRLAKRFRDLRKQANRADRRMVEIARTLTCLADNDLPGPAFWVAVLGASPFDPLIRVEMQRVQNRIAEAVAETVEQGIAQRLFQPGRPARDIAVDYAALAFGFWSMAVIEANPAAQERQFASLSNFAAREFALPAQQQQPA